MKRRGLAVALLAAVWLMTAMAGCAGTPTAPPPRTSSAKTSAEAATSPVRSTPLKAEPGDYIAARFFLTRSLGWEVGTTEHGGDLILKTSDGGKRWVVLDRNPDRFALYAVDFVDAEHGWAVGGTPSAGYIVSTDDGGVSWQEQGLNCGGLTSVHFTDALHGRIAGVDGNQPSHPITLTTDDGGRTWAISRR